MSCSACDGGLNTIVPLNVPSSERADGSAVDVSGLVGEKSVEISGTYEGQVIIMGSHDGVRYVPVLVFDSGSGAQAFKQTLNIILKFMLVRRRARALAPTTTLGVNVGSRATCACS